jgi:hypothetical protein
MLVSIDRHIYPAMPTVQQCPDPLYPPPSAADGGIGRSKPTALPDEWPGLVNTPYLEAFQIICDTRPTAYIEEWGANEVVPPGIPRDENRVRVFINANFVVVDPFPRIG